MATAYEHNDPPAQETHSSWDDRLFFLPLQTLSAPHRRLALVLGMAVAVLWGSLRNGDMMSSWIQSDVPYYLSMAQGRYDLVPQPFSARPLAPLLARVIASGLHTWPQGGFEVLAFACLLWTLYAVLSLLMRTAAPRWMLLAVAAVPFWAQLLSNAGLPDPLYAALLSCLLLALARDRVFLAALLLLPLMVTRESTSLTLVCLLAVAWRRLRWAGSGLAVASTLLGGWIVRHLNAGGLSNPEQLSGSAYLTGKLIANTLRSLGVQPWSNVYPSLCPTPVWQMPVHLGHVQAVGICGWSPELVRSAWWAILTVFGCLTPALLFLLPFRGLSPWRVRLRRALLSEDQLLLRFCVLYGGISLLLGPTLGVSYLRLIGYGWPLLLVGFPALWPRVQACVAEAPFAICRPGSHSSEGILLVCHLVVCVLGLSTAYASRLGFVIGLELVALAALVALRQGNARPLRGLGSRPGSCFPRGKIE